MSQTQHILKVKEIISLTPDAKSIIFDIPEELTEAFTYEAGQYITIVHTVDGKEYRRSYSMSSAPHEKQLQVSVKHIKGGIVSTYLVRKLQEGESLAVIAPEGRFTHLIDPERSGHYYFFGAGSGITPLYSHIKEILEEEPLSTIYLLYGNRNKANTMFYDELKALAERYRNQFYVKFSFSKSKEKKGIFNRWRSNAIQVDYAGRVGEGNLLKFINEYPITGHYKKAFICGPTDMYKHVEEFLMQNGWLKDEISYESFGVVPNSQSQQSAAPISESDVEVELNEEIIELKMRGNKTILHELLDLGYDPPYSCDGGACSSCIAKVTEGEAKMNLCFALDDEEIEQGYILTCQAIPVTKKLKVKYI